MIIKGRDDILFMKNCILYFKIIIWKTSIKRSIERQMKYYNLLTETLYNEENVLRVFDVL